MNADYYQIEALTRRVEQLEHVVAQLVQQIGGRWDAAPQSNSPIPGVPDDVIAAIQERNKILAIKLYREYTGLGLREAKEAVDAFTIQLRMG